VSTVIIPAPLDRCLVSFATCTYVRRAEYGGRRADNEDEVLEERAASPVSTN